MRHYEYKDWRWTDVVVPQILKRDNYTCQKCGAIHNLRVHHRYYDGRFREWEYPHEAMVTLCASCNKAANNIKQDLGAWADGSVHYNAMVALRDLFDNGGAVAARNALFNLLSQFQSRHVQPVVEYGQCALQLEAA